MNFTLRCQTFNDHVVALYSQFFVIGFLNLCQKRIDGRDMNRRETEINLVIVNLVHMKPGLHEIACIGMKLIGRARFTIMIH
jgi:hypothetical protein